GVRRPSQHHVGDALLDVVASVVDTVSCRPPTFAKTGILSGISQCLIKGLLSRGNCLGCLCNLGHSRVLPSSLDGLRTQNAVSELPCFCNLRSPGLHHPVEPGNRSHLLGCFALCPKGFRKQTIEA